MCARLMPHPGPEDVKEYSITILNYFEGKDPRVFDPGYYLAWAITRTPHPLFPHTHRYYRIGRYPVRKFTYKISERCFIQYDCGHDQTPPHRILVYGAEVKAIAVHHVLEDDLNIDEYP